MASRSLGTLTLDLVAKVGGFEAGMDKASRKSKKTANDITKNAKAIGIGIAAGAAAAVAGISVLVSRQLDVIDAQAKMAQRLRTTYDSLTTLGRAGELAGVSMQQIEVASRSLDINLGKASQGIGAQADALAKLKLNADDLAKLPLDKRISAINEALKNNVSVTERAAIAADLFGARGAAAIQMLDPATIAEAAKQAEIFGLNINDIDAAKIEQAGDALSTFGLVSEGIGKQLTVEIAPILKQIGDEFLRSAEAAGGLGTVVQDTTSRVVDAVGVVANVIDGFRRVFDIAVSGITTLGAEVVEFFTNRIGGVLSVLDNIPGIDLSAARSSLASFAEFADAVSLEAQARIQNNLNKPLVGDSFRDFYDNAQKAGQAAAAAAVEARTETGNFSNEVSVASEELAKITVRAEKWKESADIKETIEAWDAYKKLVSELRTEEEKLTDQLNERFAIMDRVAGLSEAERNKTASRIADAALVAAPEYGGLAPEIGGAFGELNKISKAESELEEWYSTQLEMLDKFRAERADLNSVWDEQELALKQEHEDRLAEIEQARQIASLASAESLFGNLADISRTFAGEQSGIYKAMFLAQKAAAIAQSLVAIQTGIALAAANPWPANLAAMASVASATAGLISSITSVSIAGQAHDGIDSVPMSGTWNLQKGERVTTEKTSAKLDRTLDNVQQSMDGGGMSQQNIRIVNQFDTDDVVGGYLGSSSAEEKVMNIVRKNQRTIKSLTV